MIATDVCRALVLGSVPVAYAFDALTFPHMLVVAFLMGTMTVLFHVSYSSLFWRSCRATASSRGVDHHMGAGRSRTSSGRASAACSSRCSRHR